MHWQIQVWADRAEARHLGPKVGDFLLFKYLTFGPFFVHCILFHTIWKTTDVITNDKWVMARRPKVENAEIQFQTPPNNNNNNNNNNEQTFQRRAINEKRHKGARSDYNPEQQTQQS